MRFVFNPITNELNAFDSEGGSGSPIETITGNSGGAVSPDGSFNINVVGQNTTGITAVGNLAANTLTIQGIAATTTQVGVSRYATNVEATNRTPTDVALTPGNITSFFSTTPLPSSQGGTGLSSPTANSLLVTNGASAMTVLGAATNGQIPIGSTGANPVLATLTAGAGISITNAAGSITLAVTSSGFTWTDVTGATQALVPQNGYLTDRGGGVTYTLPSSSATIGDTILVTGKLGLATIAQNAGQQILISSSSSTIGVGGSVAATNVGDCITLICITGGTSSVWRAQSLVGNWTVV